MSPVVAPEPARIGGTVYTDNAHLVEVTGLRETADNAPTVGLHVATLYSLPYQWEANVFLTKEQAVQLRTALDLAIAEAAK